MGIRRWCWHHRQVCLRDAGTHPCVAGMHASGLLPPGGMGVEEGGLAVGHPELRRVLRGVREVFSVLKQ